MRKLALMFTLLVASFTCLSCSDDGINKNLDLKTPVSLIIGGPWEECVGMDSVADKFMKKYKNCTLKYEFVDDYNNNLPLRLNGDSNSIDLFISDNIVSNSKLVDYALDLETADVKKEMDFSDCFDGFQQNYTFLDSDNVAHLYTVCFGGEVRGLFVNKTLLNKFDLSIPTKASELLNCAKVLKENDYIAFAANPATFGQQLMYPSICNRIVNADDNGVSFNKVNNRDEGVSELFRPDISFVYELMTNYYYEYKKVETDYKEFIDQSNLGICASFLDLKKDSTTGLYTKSSDVGNFAFVPGTLSLDALMQQTKENYHSEIDYEFILAPVSEQGEFAYLSPAKGLVINKNTSKLDWAKEFMNFFFEGKNNELFCDKQSLIPSTKEAISYLADRFGIPENRACHVGQATFSYQFFTIMKNSLVEVSKGNNPKYMAQDENEEYIKDKEGNNVFYDIEYYMNRLENSFQESKAS